MKTRLLLSIVAVLAVATLGSVYAFWGPKWPWTRSSDSIADNPKSDEPRTEVVLSPEKFATLKLTSVSVTKRALQDERIVPGLITYKHVSRVDLKAPVDAVVEEVLVKPGDALEPGKRLATLTSPDVGMARAEVEKSAAELRIANHALEFTEEITRNLDDLLRFLRRRPEPLEVEKEFDDRVLGDHREKVLPAYSAYVLADNLYRSAEELVKKAALSDQMLRQRESNREIAREKYKGAGELSKFSARQALEKARENQAYARRLMEVAQRKLNTLVGTFSEVEYHPEASTEDWRELTRFYLVAPFKGTVEDRQTSDSQRVTAGTLLFTFADTSVLEVEADVREEAWRDVASYFENGEGQVVKVRVPFGGKDREFEATVEYVGRAVDPDSRAVTIHAEFDNSQLKFKPGMLARIAIPAGTVAEALVVPEAALATHDNQTFVFVEDPGQPRAYKRVDVTIGKKTPAGVPITSGLEEGQRVVIEGTFLLKSELLLEPEED